MKKLIFSGLLSLAICGSGDAATNSLVSSNTVYNMIQQYGAGSNGVSSIYTNTVVLGSNITSLNFVAGANTTVTGRVSGAQAIIGISSSGSGISASDVTNIVNAIGGPTNGLTTNQVVGLLGTTNLVSRVLVSDSTPQDPYRWMNLTNGTLRFPAWSSDRIVGSLTPGLHFYSVTNGVDHFSIDVQHDHAAAGKSEARMIGLWDMAIVPGYNSGIQLGASTDNYNQEVHVQYANRMGWSHLFNLRGNTNGNIGSITFQGRRISTSTNLSELWIWANEPTWNTYPTPGFSSTGPQIAKFSIDGSYFYSGLSGPLVWGTNRLQAGVGTRFGSTDGGIEVTGGSSDSIILGGDFGAASRTDTASKYGWISSVTKYHSNPRLSILNWAVDGSTTSTLNIGGGTSVLAPFNRVNIYARSDSTQTSSTNLCASFTPGQVTITTNLNIGSLTTSTNGFLVTSNSVLKPPTLNEGDNWYFSSNGIPHVSYKIGGVTTIVRLIP